MKPGSSSNRSRNGSDRSARRFPITDCDYQAPPYIDRSGGHCANVPAPSFRSISRDYFRNEARYTFASEAALFARSEEHTSELQSHSDLVCRLLLEKKNNQRHLTESTPKQPSRPHQQNCPSETKRNPVAHTHAFAKYHQRTLSQPFPI